jgi:tripartite-type tricarboxylate transporter receptor subunit TctC
MKKIFIIGLFCILVCGMSAPTLAGDFPTRAITISNPWPAGGQLDVDTRRQQSCLEQTLGVDIIIKAKPGGGGSLGWSELVREKPDGYFVCGINLPHIILQPISRKDAGYKTDQIVPVVLFQSTPIALAVLKDSEFRTLEDLIAYAKKKPGAITCGGSGTWSGHHITHLQFQELVGVKMTYVPFKGASPQIAAFLGGHVRAAWGNSNNLVTHKGKIRVLAFGTKERFFHFPDVPTFKEKGIDLLAGIERGMGVPAGTPADRVKTIEQAFLKCSAKIKEANRRDGLLPLRMDSRESKAYIEHLKKVYKPILAKFL